MRCVRARLLHGDEVYHVIVSMPHRVNSIQFKTRQDEERQGEDRQGKSRLGERTSRTSSIPTSMMSHSSMVLSLSDFTHPALEMVLLLGPLAGPIKRPTQV